MKRDTIIHSDRPTCFDFLTINTDMTHESWIT